MRKINEFLARIINRSRILPYTPPMPRLSDPHVGSLADLAREINKIKTYTQEELQEILDKHKKWLVGRYGGEKANLRNADLARADLSGANMMYAVLYKANLNNADLREANLHNADLRCADLRRANLKHANLENANLRDAKIEGANLKYVNLNHANLENANLEGAILECTDLLNANLKGVELRYAKIDRAKNCPIYQVTRGFGSRDSTLTLNAYGAKEGWEYFTGCFRGSKEELIAEVRKKYEGNQLEIDRYVRVVECLESIGEVNK